jgi:hypothetical protein
MTTYRGTELFQISGANHRKPGKVVCITCKLKGCVGRCRFEVVASPHPPRAA